MLSKPIDKNEITVRPKENRYTTSTICPNLPNKTDIGIVKQQRISIMTETNRIEFKRGLTDDLDIEKLVDDGMREYI